MPQLDQDVVEKAIQGWMDKKFAAFGKWTFFGVAAAVFGLICKYLFAHGWTT